MKKKGGKKQKILAKNQRRVGSAESIGPEEVKRVGRKKRKNWMENAVKQSIKKSHSHERINERSTEWDSARDFYLVCTWLTDA